MGMCSIGEKGNPFVVNTTNYISNHWLPVNVAPCPTKIWIRKNSAALDTQQRAAHAAFGCAIKKEKQILMEQTCHKNIQVCRLSTVRDTQCFSSWAMHEQPGYDKYGNL